MSLPVVLLLAQLATPIADAPAPRIHTVAEPAGTPMPMSAAVSQARRASPRRQAASLMADGARDAVPLAGRMRNPIFELRTENWSRSNGLLAPDIDVFAVASQPLEIGGLRGIRRQLAVTDSQVATTTLASLDRDIALETVRAYVRALKARALLETLSANREALTTMVTSVRKRVKEGYSPEADLMRFTTEAARVDGDVVRARLELDRSLAALTVAIGAETPILASQLVEPGPLPLPAVGTEVIAASIARHPTVLAATAGLERSRQLTAFEEARRLPEPLITGGYKRVAGFNTLVLGIGLQIPLFDRNGVSLTQARARERGAAADRDALVYQLTHEAAASIRAAETLTERARSAPADLLAPAEDLRRSARVAFREGVADALKLIDAERVYADVQRAAIEVRLDAVVATVEARFAVGEEAIP